MTDSNSFSRFQFKRLLKQGASSFPESHEGGRRLSLLGTIDSQNAILVAERAALSTDPRVLGAFTSSLSIIQSLGENDVYKWYLASSGPATTTNARSSSPSTDPTPTDPSSLASSSSSTGPAADLKLTLIHPCDDRHISKHTPQRYRVVVETPEIYRSRVRPYIDAQVASGRTDWVHNILSGRTEQDSIVYSVDRISCVATKDTQAGEVSGSESGFILLPDLKWDKHTLSALDLLAIVRRRDVLSLRDLKKKDIGWLKTVVREIKSAVERVYGPAAAAAAVDAKNDQDGNTDVNDPHVGGPASAAKKRELLDGVVEGDMLKLFVHYHPTYYHFHIHVTHTDMEPSATQAVGKAIPLHSIISQLESMPGGPDVGMADVDMEYTVGEESELWKTVFEPLKRELQAAAAATAGGRC